LSFAIVRRTAVDVERMESGAWKTRGSRTALLFVEQALQLVLGRTELDARHVTEPNHFAAGTGLDDDVAELVFIRQAPAAFSASSKAAPVAGAPPTWPAGHPGNSARGWRRRRPRRKVASRELCGSSTPHRVVTSPEHAYLTHARQAREHVSDVERAVVAQVQV